MHTNPGVPLAAAPSPNAPQESGRAGRDGLPSASVLYASQADLEAAAKMEKGSRRGAVAAVAAFACEPGCRRRKVLAFFDESR